MIRSKQDPKLHDPELEELLSISDEELLREAAEEGHDVPALVGAMRRRIADKLRETMQDFPPAAGAQTAAPESARLNNVAARTRVLDPDIMNLDLAAISYLAILQHRWSDPVTAAAELEYRYWLQALRDNPFEVTILSRNGHDYLGCHLQHATLYLEQTTALFGRPLLRLPATPERDTKDERAALSARTDDGHHDRLSGRYQSSEVSDQGVVRDLGALIGDEECPAHVSSILEALSRLCADDHAAQSVIWATGPDLSSAEVRTASGLSTQAYDDAIRRLGSLMRRRLPDQMRTFHVRADWQSGTVDVDDGHEAIDRSSHPAGGSCVHCAAPATRCVLSPHVVPVQGAPKVRRIVVHKVEMVRCVACGAGKPTLDGRIRIERGTHRALLFLQDPISAGDFSGG